MRGISSVCDHCPILHNYHCYFMTALQKRRVNLRGGLSKYLFYF